MRAGKLPTIARLGKMFERSALVRDEADLHEVLKDVCSPPPRSAPRSR